MSTRKVMSCEARFVMVVMIVALLACCVDTVSANRRCGGGVKPHTGTGGPSVPASASVLALEDGGVLPPRRKLQAGTYVGSALGLVLLIAAIVGCICCCMHGCCGNRQVVVTQQMAAPQPAGSHQQNLVFQMPANGIEMGRLQQNPVYQHHPQGHHHQHPFAPADAHVAVPGYPAAADQAAHGGPQQAYYNPPAGYPPPPPQQQQHYPPPQQHGSSHAPNYPRKIA